MGRASEVQSAEKPIEGVIWCQKSLLMVWVVCFLEELMDFGCFWRMFWFGRFLEKEVGLILAWSPSTSYWLMRLRWFPGVWTKATSQGDCMHVACDNIICTVPGTGAATQPSAETLPRPSAPSTSLQQATSQQSLEKCLAERWQEPQAFQVLLALEWCSTLCFVTCGLLFLVQQVDLSALQPRWYQLQNHCTASTVVTSAAERSPLLGSNFPILFPVSNHKVLSLERTVFFSLCYCLFGSWIFPWCFPGALHLRHNTKKWNAMCSLLIIIDWCWKECCM